MTRRIIYFEPFSGISGDMMLGALIDIGADLQRLKDKLRLLPLDGYHLESGRCMRAGIHAAKIDVRLDRGGDEGHLHAHSHAPHDHRNFRDIREMIEGSGLSPWVKEKSILAFRKLADAEGKIHDRPADQVHFHEVGAVDSIVDMVGTMICLEEFLPSRFLSAPVNVGSGTLECRHGVYPVPGPATQELLRGVPTYSNRVSGELTTPTGAALLAVLIDEFCPRPLMKVLSTGYGAGTRDTEGSANVLRITLAEGLGADLPSAPEEEVAVIEAGIDDMSPQVYGYFQEKALSAGALDVYAAPITMKKNRPGLLVTVVCPPELLDAMAKLIFEETTTIGLRYTAAGRKTLARELLLVDTEYGPVTVKVSKLDGRTVNYAPEFEDCRKLALERGAPLKDVHAAAAHAYRKLMPADPEIARG